MSRFGIPVGALHLNTLNGILPILSAQHISPFAPAGAPPSPPTGLGMIFTLNKGKYIVNGSWTASSGATSYTYSLTNITTSVVYYSNIVTSSTSFTTPVLVMAGTDTIQLLVKATNASGSSSNSSYNSSPIPT
jgi:hypothetical protein